MSDYEDELDRCERESREALRHIRLGSVMPGSKASEHEYTIWWADWQLERELILKERWKDMDRAEVYRRLAQDYGGTRPIEPEGGVFYTDEALRGVLQIPADRTLDGLPGMERGPDGLWFAKAGEAPPIERQDAGAWILDQFQPDDRIAVLIRNPETDDVIQRIARAEKIASDSYQGWLHHMNANRNDIYLGMNALKPEARGRTREEIGAVRHVYLDLDTDGEAKLAKLRSRMDLPQPHSIQNTSPGKYHVIWKVEGFSKHEAEDLMRHLARETGADPAATDAARVLRLPGFRSYKHEQPHFVTYERRDGPALSPEAFPAPQPYDRTQPIHHPTPYRGTTGNSQSERDWAYALRALARGDAPGEVIAKIAQHRQDKPKPEYYARHTVKKAERWLNEHGSIARSTAAAPDR